MTSNSKQLLVTGGSGFLGSRIVDLALDAGWKVRTLNRVSHPCGERAEVVVGDLADCAILRQACEGVSVLVHAAGLAHVFGSRSLDLAAFSAVNETGTRNVVEAALEAGVAHVVLISSVSAYGPHDAAVCDETAPCHPEGPYAVSKWRGELRASERIAKDGGSLTILRMATIYGERDRGNVAKLITALDRGRFLWPGSGQNRKSLIYKDDAARACICALKAPASGIRIFNVSAPAVTMREIVTAICHALGRPVPWLGIPQPLLLAISAIAGSLGYSEQLRKPLLKFIRDDVYSASKFDVAYGFHPVVSLAEGIRRQVNFLRFQSSWGFSPSQTAR